MRIKLTFSFGGYVCRCFFFFFIQIVAVCSSFFQTRIKVCGVFYVLFFLVETERRKTHGKPLKGDVTTSLCPCILEVSWHTPTPPPPQPCAAAKRSSHNNKDFSDMKWGSGSRRAFRHQIGWMYFFKCFHFKQKNHTGQNSDWFSNISIEHTLHIFI